ncbi:hypothetical protein CONLIGDRAFT_695198 [Coniochaeta ligniaria NRRL 30616]|uniref:Serine protein kinase n=1 Tax=Coniochaeta ligniaria NRRL 30616 TaxID=1408157 RepID=A0A1J7JU70_9PEZI|nr:hypothetical protein CONLIGDRAFT_695198 [Coniochaeta ligniaria NRRL 30616]
MPSSGGEDPRDPKIPDIVHVPNDNFFQFERNGTLVICSTGIHVIPDDYKFDAARLMVFAEEIKLQGNLKLPGRDIVLSCNTLRPLLSNLTIDVSGGPPASDSSNVPIMTKSTDTGTGDDGSPAGSISLYVEKMSKLCRESLSLKANGGRGGLGSDTTVPDMKGGDGGTGASGGLISVAYGSPEYALADSIGEAKTSPWSKAAAILHDRVLTEPSLGSSLTDAFTKLVQRLTGLSQDMEKAARLLEKTVNETTQGRNLSLGARMRASDLSSTLSDALTLTWTSSSVTALESWLEPKSVFGEDALLKAFDNAQGPSSLSLPDLYKPLDSIYDEALAAAGQVEVDVEFDMCRVDKGDGGLGGHGATSQSLAGHRGDDGKPGTVYVSSFSADGPFKDEKLQFAHAFPDQCQMLLNMANSRYFSNDKEQWARAALLYQRLIHRLDVVKTLTSADDDNSALLGSYRQLETQDRLSLDVLSQLSSVHTQATTYLNGILLNQDMFGLADNYSPRLSYEFYRGRITEQLATLEKLVDKYDAYMAAMKTQDKAADAIEAIKADFSKRQQNAEDRISILSDPNGPIKVNAYQISLFTPLLKSKRAKISAAVEKVKTAIQNSLNVDPMMVIEALSTLSMAPTKFTGAVQVVNFGYKATTEVKDASGASIPKEYVISQLAASGSSIASLVQAYEQRSNKTLECDDPGAIKIMADQDKISEFLRSFKNAIPADAAGGLQEELNGYVEMIKLRNSAVVQFNSAVEQLARAVENRDSSTRQAQHLGSLAASLDSNLPTVSLWLRRGRDDLRLDIMQHINLASRAVRYWGLQELPGFSTPGPLQDHAALSLLAETVAQKWSSAWVMYANSTTRIWPNADQTGPVYRLTTSEMATLRQVSPSLDRETGKTVPVHSVMIRLEPGMRANNKTDPDAVLLHGRPNIRLSQVRFWLVGAKIDADDFDRQTLPVKIFMLGNGNEKIVGTNHKVWTFSHDAVPLDADIDISGIKTLKDCMPSRTLDRQQLGYIEKDTDSEPKAHTLAPIGPWALWRFEIEQTRGLQIPEDADGYIEFRGISQSYTE